MRNNIVCSYIKYLLSDIIVELLYNIGCQLECNYQRQSLLDDTISSHGSALLKDESLQRMLLYCTSKSFDEFELTLVVLK